MTITRLGRTFIAVMSSVVVLLLSDNQDLYFFRFYPFLWLPLARPVRAQDLAHFYFAQPPWPVSLAGVGLVGPLLLKLLSFGACRVTTCSSSSSSSSSSTSPSFSCTTNKFNPLCLLTVLTTEWVGNWLTHGRMDGWMDGWTTTSSRCALGELAWTLERDDLFLSLEFFILGWIVVNFYANSLVFAKALLALPITLGWRKKREQPSLWSSVSVLQLQTTSSLRLH